MPVKIWTICFYVSKHVMHHYPQGQLTFLFLSNWNIQNDLQTERAAFEQLASGDATTKHKLSIVYRIILDLSTKPNLPNIKK